LVIAQKYHKRFFNLGRLLDLKEFQKKKRKMLRKTLMILESRAHLQMGTTRIQVWEAANSPGMS